jgi:hypothetical protein
MTAESFKNPYQFNDDDFAPRGAIQLDPAAIEEARQFLSELGANERDGKWVVAFTWCYGRTFQKSSNSPNVDEGPGIDIAGYRTKELPPGVIEVRNGVPVAFIIPAEQLAAASRKAIVETRLASGRMSYKLV